MKKITFYLSIFYFIFLTNSLTAQTTFNFSNRSVNGQTATSTSNGYTLKLVTTPNVESEATGWNTPSSGSVETRLSYKQSDDGFCSGGGNLAALCPTNFTNYQDFWAPKSITVSLDNNQAFDLNSISMEAFMLSSWISDPNPEGGFNNNITVTPSSGNSVTGSLYDLRAGGTNAVSFTNITSFTITGTYGMTKDGVALDLINMILTPISTNNTPTDITLGNNSINQTQTGPFAQVGFLSTTDSDTDDSHTYTFVTGTGDTNNDDFEIMGNTLNTATALNAGTYSVRINTNDGTANFAKSLQITVVDNIAPTIEVTNLNSNSRIAKFRIIRYNLSEDLASGTLTFTRTGGEPDTNSPYIINLENSQLVNSDDSFVTITNELNNNTIYKMELVGTDAGGNISNIIELTNIVYDNVSPQFTNVLPQSNTTFNLNFSYTLSEDLSLGIIAFERTGGAADPNEHEIDLTGDELKKGTFSGTPTNATVNLVDGAIYTVYIFGQDLALNFASLEIENLTFDGSAPEFSNVSISSNSFITNTNFVYSLSEEATSGTITFTRTGGTADANSPHTLTLSGDELLEGQRDPKEFNDIVNLVNGTTYTISFEASDAIGNTAPISFTNVTFDDTPPVDPIVTLPANIIYVNAATQTVSGTHPEDGITINAYPDGNDDGIADSTNSLGTATVANGEWSFSVNLTSDFDNNFVVQALDGAGNTSNDVNVPTIIEDSTNPANPLVTSPASPIFVNTTSATISGTHSEDGVVIHAYMDTNNDGTADDNNSLGNGVVSNGSFSFTITVTLNIDNNFVIRAVDQANNASSAIDVPTIKVDTTIPKFSNVTPSSSSLFNKSALGYSLSETLTSGTVTFTRTGGTTDPNSPHTVNIISSDLSGLRVSSTLFNHPDLVDGAIYTIALNGVDAAGNTADTFTITNATYDNTPPALAITNPTSFSTINSLAFTYSLSEDLSKGQVVFTDFSGKDTNSPHTINLTGDELKAGNFSGVLANAPTLNDESTYSIQFFVEDFAGNGGFPRLLNITYEEINVGFASTSSSGAENVPSTNIAVEISEASSLPITVDYAITGTAIGDGTDYTLTNGTLTFPANITSQNITIASIIDDDILEANETVIITLSNPTNSTLGTNTVHTYTITNNDAASITIEDISKNENDGDITFTATLDNDTAEPFTIDVLTSDGTATTSDSDYTPLTGTTLSFSGTKGETKTFTLSPTSDTKVEADETVDISMNNLQNTTLPIDITDTATATIKNDDEASIAINDVSKAENADGNSATFTFTVSLTGAVDESFTVDYATVDNIATNADNDYTSTSGTLNFSGTDGETKTFDVVVNNDNKVEADETFDVLLSNLQANGKNVKISDDIGSGTITNDDVATLSINNVTALENADSGATTSFLFTVTLTGQVDETLTVDYITQDNTAIAGSDYTATSGTLSFNGTNGETQTFIVSVSNDDIVEADETFTILLSNVQANGKNVTIPNNSGTGTITNDDSATLSINNVTTIENADGGATTTLQFDVTLSGTVDSGFSVNYATVNGTALAGSDFNFKNGQLTFTGNDKEVQSINITVINDEIVEIDENLGVGLFGISANGRNVTINDFSGTGIITNDDATTVTVEDISASEDGTFTLTFTSSNAVDNGFTVDVNTADGTATTANSDYSPLNAQTLFFTGNANETQTITLSVNDDAIVEANETIDISINNPTTTTVNIANILATDIATVTIQDNDNATLAINDVTAVENADGGATTSFLFTATLTGQIDQVFTVDYATQDGAAITGSDYTSTSGTLSFNGTNGETQTFIVSVINDAIVESDEAFSVLLSNIQANGKNITFTDDTAIGTITNDDTTAVIIEDISKSEEETFTVTLTSSAVVDGGFSIDINTNDISATAGDDYTAITGQTINFAGTAIETKTFTITVADDDIVEGIEEIGISISNPVAATVATSTIQINDTGRAVIQDNDTTTITVEDISAAEDGTFTLTFTSSNAVDNGFTIDVNTADGTATIADSDYTAFTSKTIRFSGTKDEKQTITLSVNNDTKVEFDETVDISMNNSTAGTVDTTSILISDTATVTIEDNDAATLVLNDVTILENADGGSTTSFLFTATLTGEIDQTFTVDYATQDDTAIAGSDYTSTSGTLSFNGTSGETQTFIVSVVNDDIAEVDEAFTVLLTNIQANGKNVTFTDDTAVGTITNDDNATLTINDISANEDDGDITVTVALDKVVQGGFSVDFTTTDGTAIAGTDYTVNSGTLSFIGTENETQTFTVSPTVDTTDENDETINISLSNLSNTNIATIDITDTAIVTLLNDDIPPTVTLSVDNNTIIEKDGNATLTATLSEFSAFDITVNLTYSGTAINGTDYESNASTTVTIPAGTTTVDFTPIISIIDDDFSEDNETIIVDISSIVKGTEDDVQQQTITIIDDDAPFVTIVNVPSPKNYGINQELDFTVNFNKEVFITGTPRLALTLSTGVVFADYVSGSTSSSLVFKYIVNEGDVDNDVPQLPENIDLNSGSIKDNNTNDAILELENIEDTSLVIVDGVKPTVSITSTAPDPINTSFVANITFSEAVTKFEIGDVNLTNATASNFVTTSTSEYAVTITPTTDGDVKISLDSGIAFDLAENPNEASNEYSILYDETHPEVTISSPAPNPTNDVFTVTFTFTEDVFGFDINDITLTNAVASEFTMSSNSVYTATITPGTDGNVVVKLEAGVTEDEATNPNKASDEFIIEFDETPPNPPIITHISEYTCSGNVAVTGDNTIEIFGSSEANSTVDIFLNGEYLATVEQGNGFFSFDYSDTELVDGTYELTAQTTDEAGNLGEVSDTFTFTIDTVDTDGDGIADFCDGDDDGNGVADVEEDCDGDGIIDRFDTDNSACSLAVKNTTRYGFSPNNDGVNEAWVIPNILAYPNNVVRVYNRSSKIVFEEKGYKNTWEGVSNKIAGNSLNKKLPVGPYLFVVDLGDGSAPIRGWLYINY